MAKRRGDYPREFYSEFHCYCCGGGIAEPDNFGPIVCPECWRTFAPAEKAARWEAARLIRIQQEINIALEHQTSDAIEVAQAAKAIENLTKLMRWQEWGTEEFRGKVVAFITRILNEYPERGDRDSGGGGGVRGRDGDLN